MNLLTRLVALVLISSLLLPLLAGCGKSEKAMETPGGVSARDKRDQAKGLPPGT